MDESLNENKAAGAPSALNVGLGCSWVIAVGGGYGAFIFEGTEDEAEEMRCHKARWEGAVALKRKADDAEIKSCEASQCWNHKNFSHAKNGLRYSCECCA